MTDIFISYAPSTAAQALERPDVAVKVEGATQRHGL